MPLSYIDKIQGNGILDAVYADTCRVYVSLLIVRLNSETWCQIVMTGCGAADTQNCVSEQSSRYLQ